MCLILRMLGAFSSRVTEEINLEIGLMQLLDKAGFAIFCFT